MIHLLRVCVISVVPALRCSTSTLNQNTPKIPSQSIRACWPISTVTNPVPSLLWGAFHSRHVQGSRSWKCAKCRLSEKLTDRHYIPSPCSGKNLHSIRCASPPPSFLWHIGLVTFLCFKLPELERLYAQTLQGTRAIVFLFFWLNVRTRWQTHISHLFGRELRRAAGVCIPLKPVSEQKTKKQKKRHSTPTTPTTQKKLHKGDHRGRNFTGKPAALTSVSGDKCPLWCSCTKCKAPGFGLDSRLYSKRRRWKQVLEERYLPRTIRFQEVRR